MVSEAGAHLLHLDLGSLMGVGVLAGGWWLLRRRSAVAPLARPASLGGWLERCEALLDQFGALEASDAPSLPGRRAGLDRLRQQIERSDLSLALTGCRPPSADLAAPFAAALRTRAGLRLHWGHPLPAATATRSWPEEFEQADVVLHHLRLPLSAVDLRWLEALPEGQPAWLLVEAGGDAEPAPLAGELASLWSGADPSRLLVWDGRCESVEACLAPLKSWLASEAAALRPATSLRCLESLHGRWQADLEQLRRREWRGLLQRTQWIVAAGVVVTPLPSVDLLVLAVANGLMLQEMARLWNCPWQAGPLRAAAVELARACLALGVVEWTGQALAAAIRLHGATWLVGGALQALSAAYLTRVVGHAMADVMALSAGVSEPDLEAIRREAPLLVARAAEAERTDWPAFLREARRWLQQQTPALLQQTS